MITGASDENDDVAIAHTESSFAMLKSCMECLKKYGTMSKISSKSNCRADTGLGKVFL